MKEFHLIQHEPSGSWPDGSWSLYEITGEQIAERTRWERKEDGKHVISERHGWFGYIGMFTKLTDAVAAMQEKIDA